MTERITDEPFTDEEIRDLAEWASQYGCVHLPDDKLRGRKLINVKRAMFQLLEERRWRPQFDVMAPEQERLVQEFCVEIAGRIGERPRRPDPVRLLEMAQALYDAEREHYFPTPPQDGGD